MFAALRSGLGRLNLTLLGLALLAATFWFTDQITNRQPPAPAIDRDAVLARHRSHPSDARVFVYIIDSLRYETAINPEIMPHLAALRAEGAHARMDPGFNSSTAASLRNAFTGRENAAVLAIVATFVHTDAGVESLFHQMAQQGLTSAAYSEGSFRQFGAGLTREVSISVKASHDEQDAHVLAAADALRDGGYNCTLAHLFYTDHVAHEEGVGTPVYRDTFRRADALIPLIRAKLPPGATLVVTGDHGHDLKGRHGIALDVPTLGVYAGPRFQHGVDLGTTPVMTHRYLLSQALGLPITTDAYKGDLLPAALTSTPVVMPPDHANAGPLLPGGDWLIWLYLSFIASLWLNLVCRGASPLDFSGLRPLALWAGLVPLLLHGHWQVTSGLLAAGGLFRLLAWRLPWRSLALWLALPVLAALAFHGWGRVLIAGGPWLRSLPAGALAVYWLAVAAAGALFATRTRRPLVMAAVFAVPAFLFHPVYHRYGFPGTLAPLMACWFVFYVSSLARDGALRERGARVKLLCAAAGLFLLLQPFAATGTVSGNFDRWHALIPGWKANHWMYLLGPALLAKGLLFFPRLPGRPALVLSVVVIGLLQLIEARLWVPDFYARLQLTLLMLAGWAAGAWWKRPEARLCGLACLFLLYFSFVALTPRNFMETAAMLGALALCAQVVVWFPQRENIRADYVVLALFGLMITGWAGMRWSGTHLEWHAIYEFASASTVENHVGWFVPWIALKGLLPWVIILWMLRERLGDWQRLPAHALLAIFCAKLVSLLMLNTGLGGLDTRNQDYLETACVVGALTMLYLGVILLPRAWPAPSRP